MEFERKRAKTREERLRERSKGKTSFKGRANRTKVSRASAKSL